MTKETYTCTSCNTAVSVDAKFCPNCGEKFDGIEEVVDESISNKVEDTIPFWKKWYLWVIAITVIAVIIGSALIIYGKSQVKYIGNFDAFTENNKIKATFSLMDDSKKTISGKGTGEVRIVNSEGENVYGSTINVNPEDFGTYTLKLTNEDFLAYSWNIPLNDIKKSPSQEGTIYLKFRTDNAEFDEIDSSIFELPTYSEEELAEINTKKFNETALSVDKTLSKGSFTVTVKKAGFFKPFNTLNEKKEYFRVDLDVKNIGNKKEYFSLSGLSILGNKGKQYDSEYGGSLDSLSELHSGIKKSGYVLFEKIPDKVKQVKLVFELGEDKNYEPYRFEFSIPSTK